MKMCEKKGNGSKFILLSSSVVCDIIGEFPKDLFEARYKFSWNTNNK